MGNRMCLNINKRKEKQKRRKRKKLRQLLCPKLLIFSLFKEIRNVGKYIQTMRLFEMRFCVMDNVLWGVGGERGNKNGK